MNKTIAQLIEAAELALTYVEDDAAQNMNKPQPASNASAQIREAINNARDEQKSPSRAAELLQTAAQYLNHPEVKAIPFALPSANIARAVYELAANIKDPAEGETRNVHLIAVKYHGATNTKPSRISLTSQRFENNRVTFSYNCEYNSSTEQAKQWLKEHGYTPLFEAEAPNIAGFIAVAEFTPLSK